MTNDLKTQVRDYTEFFVSTVEPVELDELLALPVSHRAVQPIEPTGADRPRALWVAMLAGALILIVVGGVTLLTRLGGNIAPVEEPSISTTIPEPVSTTATEVQCAQRKRELFTCTRRAEPGPLSDPECRSLR